ncbi:hypothetical protein ACRRTK_020520 [Alexandromys fortis]
MVSASAPASRLLSCLSSSPDFSDKQQYGSVSQINSFPSQLAVGHGVLSQQLLGS